MTPPFRNREEMAYFRIWDEYLDGVKPEATLNAVADHGDIPADSIHGTYEQSQAVLDDLAALGIGYDDVVQTLEDQGVTAFDASWDHLGQRLATALGTPGR